MAKSVKELLNLIEPFCIEYKIGKTEFGVKACKNPNLINDLRDGRAPTLTTVEKIMQFIDEYKRHRDRTMARFYEPMHDTGLFEHTSVRRGNRNIYVKKPKQREQNDEQ